MNQIFFVLTLGLIPFLREGESYNYNLSDCTNSSNPSLKEEDGASVLHKLDHFCDAKSWGWHVSETKAEWALSKYWFYYVDSFDLPSFAKASGVWVANFTTRNPIFAEPHPIIRVPVWSQGKSHLEITYYLQNTAKIRLLKRNNKESFLDRPVDETQQDKWITFNITDFNGLKILLIANQPGDFVLIDKIVIYKDLASTTHATTEPHTTTVNQDCIPTVMDPNLDGKNFHTNNNDQGLVQHLIQDSEKPKILSSNHLRQGFAGFYMVLLGFLGLMTVSGLYLYYLHSTMQRGGTPFSRFSRCKKDSPKLKV